ncbi:MAG: HAMP domain-containing histidine kinase [Planctomycetes bacterium]|nr:HAMP domain-containing histidine kinase [Planctomycetota bacterium]
MSRLIDAVKRPRFLAFCLAIMALVGACDYLTGSEFSFGLFYLLPIGLAAWWGGRLSAAVVVAAATATWLGVDLASFHPYESPLAPYWNAFVRLGTFGSVAWTLVMIRELQIRQQDHVNYVVHDLRNPLTAIMGNLEFLRSFRDKPLTAALFGRVEDCLVAASRMNTLIGSILDLSRLEHGRMQIRPRVVPPSELAETALHEVSLFAKSQQVSLSSQLEDGLGRAHADPALTARILVNLLTNAIKASPPGSTVLVRAAPGDGGKIVFSVVDQGEGIPSRYVRNVFDKFVQARLRQAGYTLGSGLGLAFCRLAVTEQKGRIWLDSEVGRGTTVYFTLPAATESQEPATLPGSSLGARDHRPWVQRRPEGAEGGRDIRGGT